jgi:hypothetical protein
MAFKLLFVEAGGTTTMNQQSEIYDETSFWLKLSEDFKRARGCIRIVSPFLGYRRIESLIPTLKSTIERGITICANVQAVHPWDVEKEAFQRRALAIALLRNIGVHVTSLDAIHQKLIIIDESVVWEGSLNVLSHTQTKEHMRRWCDRDETARMVALHNLAKCPECMDSFRRLFIPAGLANELAPAAIVGRRLAAERVRIELSQRDISKQYSLSQSRISEIESGKRDLRFETLSGYADYLGLEVVLVPKFLLPSVARLLDRAIELS